MIDKLVNNEFAALTFIEWFYVVAFVWCFWGLATWPFIKMMMKAFGIETMFGRKMTAYECMVEGPVTPVMLALILHCPEAIARMNEDLKSVEDDDEQK